MKNILIVTNSFITEKKGGSETYIYQICKRLAISAKVIILTGKENCCNTNKEYLFENMLIFKYNIISKNFINCWLSIIINSYKAFKKIIKKYKFDLIILNHPQSSLGIIITKKSTKCRKISCFYSLWFKELFLNIKPIHFSLKKIIYFFWKDTLFLLMKIIQKYCLIKSEKIIVLSEYSKNQLINFFNIKEEKIEIIPPAIDTDKFTLPNVNDRKKIKESLRIPLEKFIILTVRRLVKRMGLEDLISAMYLLIEQKQEVLLYIIGNGPLRKKLENYSSKLNLTKYIYILSSVSDELLVKYYQAADFFVIPSIDLEGFGIVILEALSSGLPVLGTDVGAIPQILKNLDKRLIIKKKSPHILAKTIKNYIKKENLNELKKKCRDFIMKNYSMEKLDSQIKKIII